MNLKKWLRKEYIALVLYAILVIFLAQHHEPWRDEADTWLMVRDCSLTELFERMPYAGTPALWYLVLWPFAQLGFPYITINVVTAILGIASVAILMRFSPFGFFANSLIAFSYLFSYEYPVVARSYQLSILFIFLLAAFHRSRFSRPLFYSAVIALLANTSVHGLIVALSIACTYAVSLLRQKPPMVSLLKSALPAGIGIVLAIFQLIQPADGQQLGKDRRYSLSYTCLTVREAFSPQTMSIDHSMLEPLSNPPAQQAISVLVVLAILGVLVAIRKSPWAISTMFLSWMGLLALFVFVYGGALRHWGFLVIMTIYALWIAEQEAQSKGVETRISPVSVYDFCLTKGAFTATLLLSVLTAVAAWTKDTNEQFSGGKSAAIFISAQQLDQFPIASHPASLAKSILPYLPKERQLYYSNQDRFGSYGKWDAKTYTVLSERRLMRRLDRRFGKRSKLVLVVGGTPLKNPDASDFRLVYKTPPTMTTDEEYFVYVRDGQQQASNYASSVQRPTLQ